MRDRLEMPVLLFAAASLLLPLVVPLSISPSTLSAKVFFFQTIILFLGTSYVLLLFRNWQRYRPRLTPLTWTIILWGVSLGVSTFFSVDRYQSLWSTNMRMTGIVLVAQFIFFYLVCSAVIREWKYWKILFRLFLGIGIIAVFFGLVFQGGERVSSTLGNATFFGGFTLFLVFLSALLASKEKENSWLLFSLFGFVAALFGLFASGTRGAFVGLLCGLGFALFFYLIAMARRKMLTIGILGLTGLVLLAFFVAWPLGAFQRDNPTATAHTRLLAWEAAFEAWQDKPIFGWGPNNFAYAFNAHYPPEILQYGMSETWFDLAHSVPFDTLATQGLVGLAAYLGIFGAVGFMLWKGWKERVFDTHVVSIGGGLLVAYFVQNLFLFDTPISYLFFFLFLAFLNSQYHPKNSSAEPPKRNILPQAIITFLVVLALLILSASPFTANKLLARAQSQLKEHPQEAIGLYKKAKEVHSPYFRSASTPFLWSTANSLVEIREENEVVARQIFVFSQKEVAALRTLHPLEIQLNLLEAQLHEEAIVLFPEQDFRQKIEKILEDGLAKSPGRQEFQYRLALTKLKMNKPAEAISLLEGMRSPNPGIQKGWSLLLCTYPPPEEIKETIENMLRNGEFPKEGETIVQKVIDPC